MTDLQLSFRNSGHVAKRLTSAHRERVFLWTAAVYFSSFCQEKAAACRQCTHRLCLVNSTSDIRNTVEGCRSTEIDFCFCFLVSFFFSLSSQQSTSVSKPQWVYLEVGAIYRNHVNQAWINTEVAEHFKHLQKNDDAGNDRGKDFSFLFFI